MLGTLVHGLPHEEHHELHPETAATYSYDPEHADEAANMASLIDLIKDEQNNNVAHQGTDVPRHSSPFSEYGERIFFETLANVVLEGVTPAGYGILQDEWTDGVYPAVEKLDVGRRGKASKISLSADIWLQRATLWVQGLSVLTMMTTQ
jgi:hypothetical protein